MSLRSWLRKQPQPERVRIRTLDGEERFVELTDDVRGKWKTAEETILAAGAVSVDCLGPVGKDGKPAVLRAQRLEYEDGDVSPADGMTPEERGAEKMVKARMAELASVLDAQGKRLNEATRLGLESKLGATDQLIALVTTLTEQMTGFILNMSNLAKTVGELLQGAGIEGSGKDKGTNPVMEKLLMMGMMRMLGMSPDAMRAQAEAAAKDKPNGKSKG